MDRLVGEHARGRRALLAGVVERRLDQRGDDVVEIGVGVHDHAVLPAHLGHDTLEMPLPGRDLGGAPHDLQPDRPGAGERDRVHARVADQRRADRPFARQQRQRGRRQAGLAQRAHEHVRARGRLLGGLERPRRCRSRAPARDHPERDRDREVPGRDDGDDAARRPAQLVALAGQLDQLAGALGELDRLARVVLEEVDRLAHVGVRLAPRLGGLAHLERRDLQPPLAQPRRPRAPAPPRAPSRACAATRCARRGRARGRRRPRRRSPTPPRRARARPGRPRSARRRRACPRRPTPAPGSPARRRRPPARRAAAPASAPAAARGSARWRTASSATPTSAGPREQLFQRHARAPARTGTTRWRCSPAAAARGRPCPPRGRRPGSRCARAGPATRSRPAAGRRARAGPAARGRSPRRR